MVIDLHFKGRRVVVVEVSNWDSVFVWSQGSKIIVKKISLVFLTLGAKEILKILKINFIQL
ncbi:hypothetical protein LMS37_14405 [Clostridium perfringens]|uniref:hypothetical protein n=1 Tax=Clostridium perfringens TaxID=1502 RepID=UPI001E2F5FF2|nr:hypothetical protein [Clostridium perfringens]MCC5434667.1 hypothetical protein [Clostridium perfringens]